MQADPGGWRNGVLLGLAAASAVVLLWLASQPYHIFIRLLAALGFAFVNNTIFSLLHEAVHGNFSRNTKLNEGAGMLAACFFPTSFTMQRAFHLTHHRNNRSDEERFDYIGENENIPLKTAQWYSILTGLYWLSIPIFVAFYAALAELLPIRRMIEKHKGFASQTSAAAFFRSLATLPRLRVRGEAAAALILHATLFWFLGVGFTGWALCYAAFGLMWSSLQYADHAYSALHREEGAWNLTVTQLTRLMFLNYHFHLVHHRDPSIKWPDLPKKTRAEDATVSFKKILFLMWSGPRLMRVSGDRQDILQLSVSIALCVVVASVFAIAYGGAALLYPQLETKLALETFVDRAIPFIPSAAAVYLTVPLIMLMVPVFIRPAEMLLPIAAGFAFQILVSSLVFVALPVQPPPKPAGEIANLSLHLLNAAEFVSQRGNYFPSLHVALSLTSAWVCARVADRPAAAAIWLWALAIVVSTLLTKQHYMADVVAGAALGLASACLVIPWLETKLRDSNREIMEPGKEFV